jgi:hypothetical protein
MPLKKCWHDYNGSLIERGRILMDIGFLRSCNKEIKRMNQGKVGAPFEFSESYIYFLVFDDGREKVVTKMTMGVIANGKSLGGGFVTAPEASISDGLLDVVILKDSGTG